MHDNNLSKSCSVLQIMVVLCTLAMHMVTDLPQEEMVEMASTVSEQVYILPFTRFDVLGTITR